MRNWNVAYVKSNCEFKVVRELQEAGVAAYAPERKVEARPRHVARGNKNKIVTITLPIYLRYIFFQAGEDSHYSIVIKNKGVIGIVKFGPDYASIREREMDKLRALVEQGWFNSGFEKGIRPVISMPDLDHGDLVNITEGLFEGKEAMFVRPIGKKAAVVVSADGRHISITLPFEHIEVI